MKMGDGGFRPAFNGQLATTADRGRVIVGVEVTNRGSDAGQSTPMLDQVEHRTGVRPAELLVDGGYAQHEAIEHEAQQQVTTYAPVPKPRKGDTRDPHVAREDDSEAVAAWRQRMGTEEAKKIYKQRAATAETVNADAKAHRGLDALSVRGRDKTLGSACLFATQSSPGFSFDRAASASSSAGICARSLGRPSVRLLAMIRSSGNTRRGMPSTTISLAAPYSTAKLRRPCMCTTTSKRSPSASPPSAGGRRPNPPGTHAPPAARAASPIAGSSRLSNQRSTSCVAVVAPWSTAAPAPTTRYRTPRRLSSSRKRRSGALRAESGKAQCAPQALRRRALEVSEDVVNTLEVEIGSRGHDGGGLSPEPLVTFEPGELLWREGMMGHGRKSRRGAVRFPAVEGPPRDQCEAPTGRNLDRLVGMPRLV